MLERFKMIFSKKKEDQSLCNEITVHKLLLSLVINLRKNEIHFNSGRFKYFHFKNFNYEVTLEKTQNGGFLYVMKKL